MRSHGTRFECLRLRPHDHVGWAFSGQYLDALPPKTGIMIDLAAATVASRLALARLGRLADSGVIVTIRGKATALSELTPALPRAIEYLVLPPAPAEAR